ncbi:MAG: hypothetical protein GC190_18230 [Alphaproteobacteria bacterium]|nr:hypothetical protein [Alphaproteobacteria bacterium]
MGDPTITGDLIDRIGHALLLSAGMFWEVGWSLVLGFLISAVLQVAVSKERMSALLGADGAREIALATLFGAASSSCSYASVAITKTLMQKGAGFIASLAFLFASTNLVIELGIILYLLMGWQFMAAEWIGGVLLILIMSILVRRTYPKRLVEEARCIAGAATTDHEHHHGGHAEARGFFGRLAATQTAIAQSFAADWSMLWKDLFAGFFIAGFLAEFVPDSAWRQLFVANADSGTQLVLNALIAPLIAVVSFVCSIGNVPMAAILWGGGISFGGVLAFLYADLIVLPLLDAYRRAFRWKMAAYIGVVFYITMVLAGIVMDLAFTALGYVPKPDPNIRAELTHFAVNYTFWLNLAFGAAALYVAWVAARARRSHG